MTEAIVTAAVLAAMAALAVHDARRAMVDPRLVLALLATAAAWRFGGGAGEDEGTWARLAGGVLGASLGVAAVMVPIATASWCGRRWPLYPGDAMLLGALGFLLGPLGLAWTMVLGSGLALIYRFFLQRRRGRPFRKGLVPLGPGMCAGAAVVFLCLNCGVALAADTRAADTLAGDEAAAGAPVPESDRAASALVSVAAETAARPLAATELAPERAALPAALAAREIPVEVRDSLPFPALVRRLAALSGVAMRIEERPSRIAGGGAALADPPPLHLVWRGTLAGLLDRVAAQTGYDWSWEDGIVFHRYWDTEQRGPAPADTAVTGGIAGAAGPWTVDPAAHESLRELLEAWAARAGWTLVWKAERDWRLGAPAVFEGSFLEAADLLLSGPATRRTLDVRAYAANRHLVVDDAGGAGW